jgi:hypothetical protein
VDQIDRRVGLQQVAPDAQARVRLTGDQQDAQPVAHAIDEEYLPVVERGDLIRRGLGLDFEHGLAGALELERHPLHGPRRQTDALAHLAVLLERHGDRLVARGRRQLLHAQRQFLRLVNHGVTGHLFDQQATVLLAGRAGQQQMDRRIDAEALQARRHVVHLAVRQDHHPGQARAVDLGEAGRERFEQPRPALAALDRGLHHLEVVEGLQVRAQLLECGVELLRALVDGLGRGAVDQHGDNVAERLAFFAHHHRVGERDKADQQHGAAPQDAARAAPQPERAHQHDRRRQQPQHRPRQEWCERQRRAAHHWPSRSSRAGMCT